MAQDFAQIYIVRWKWSGPQLCEQCRYVDIDAMSWPGKAAAKVVSLRWVPHA